MQIQQKFKKCKYKFRYKDRVEARDKMNQLVKPSLKLLTSISRFTPSEYFELEITDSPPREVRQLGKQRRLERSCSDGGYVAKKNLNKNPDYIQEFQVTVPKRLSLTPKRSLNPVILASHICGFCYRIPLNPLKTIPCDHWVCVECFHKWRMVAKSKCLHKHCLFSIEVVVPFERELMYLR